jgi:hypothetical protein
MFSHVVSLDLALALSRWTVEIKLSDRELRTQLTG